MSATHVQGHSHEQLDALVADLVQGGHLLPEVVEVVAAGRLAGYHVNTPMPVPTEEGGNELT